MSRQFRAVAAQPQWHATDFVSADAFRAWMRLQLEAARPHLHPEHPTLVVLTELNGLPLVLRGGGWALRAPLRLRRFQAVAAALLVTRLPAALPVLWRERVSPIRALQLAGADAAARLYLHTCADLAREYGVYLCCGSLPMPRYRLEGGRLRRESGVLTNQTVLLDPQGDLIGVADKVYLTPDEEAGGVDLTPGRLDELRVFPTPVGDLGVAISLDAFRADVIGRLEAQGCTVLLQPDANGSAWTAREGLAPDPEHVRDQPLAWLESSWQVTSRRGVIRYAVNPMVVGNLLDLSFDGQSAITTWPEDAPDPRSYVMTAPRPGFLALAPWVTDGPDPLLREVGQQLAAGSGHPRENAYHTDLLWADLTLSDTTVSQPAPTPHEQALRALLAGTVQNSTVQGSTVQGSVVEGQSDRPGAARWAWWLLPAGVALGLLGWALRRKR